MNRILLLILAMTIALVGVAHAAPIQWTIATGGNDNWYEAISFSSNWEEANQEAQTLTYNGIVGHLATLTSEEENSYIWKNLNANSYWLGGYQTDRLAEPGGDWAWVTGEEWLYTNWYPGEPNDFDRDGEQLGEQQLQFRKWGGGKWNDNNGLGGYVFDEPGFVVEYESRDMPVPEPSTIILLSSGLMGLAAFRKRLSKNRPG